MNIVEIIEKKRNGGKLSKEELAFWIEGVMDGGVPDYQTSALLMAIYFRGLDMEEITDLTGEMAAAGDQVDLSMIPGIPVDKHSTGGVGDTTTLITGPLVAACGGRVVKISGRGLGHTGGTIDKLEAIPGMRTALTIDQFIAQVSRIGLAVAGQSAQLAPADKILYALRDVTATTDSLGLIASSIMSKKLASGAKAIVLDVKVGSGAFMKKLDDAIALAQAMVKIGQGHGRNTRALLTNMDQPLGRAVGNAIEVVEGIEVLQGKHAESDLRKVSLLLAENMLLAAGVYPDAQSCKRALDEALASGRALEKLGEMIAAQGGDAWVIQHPERLGQGACRLDVKSASGGYVSAIDTQCIGHAALLLGAGRRKKEDTIDPLAGLLMRARLGQKLAPGETLATLFASDEALLAPAQVALLSAVTLRESPAQVPPLCYGWVDEAGFHPTK